MGTLTLTLNLTQFLSFAFVGFITILAVKFIIALLALLLVSKQEARAFYISGGLLMKMASRWFLSLVVSVIVALVVSLLGMPLTAVVSACAVLAVVGSFLV